MQNFHDDKLWQGAYMAVMGVYDVTGESTDELISMVRTHALHVLSYIADALSRKDRRIRAAKLSEAGGSVASLRSLLSVAWGQQMIADEDFKKIDTAYDDLGKQLLK